MLRCEAADLFGRVRAMEKANVNPDLRNVATFADELARELKITAEIQADPFKHLPFPLPNLSATLKKAHRAMLAGLARRNNGGNRWGI